MVKNPPVKQEAQVWSQYSPDLNYIPSFKGNKLDLHLFIWINLEKSIEWGGHCSRICTMWNNVYKFWKYIVYCLFVSVLVTQLCPTHCGPMGCSLPGSSVHGSLQVRILEWVSIPFSRWSSWPRDQIWVSHITGRFFTMSHQGSPVCCLWANKYLEKLENYLCWEVHTSFWTVFTSNKRRKILG